MTPARLDDLLAHFADLRMAVIGDFFVDYYLEIDPSLAEVSVETCLEARQVVSTRCQAGAAGTVTNNLAALGVGHLAAIGWRGDDGLGFELQRALEATGVDPSRLVLAPGRCTPTYTKPLVREPAGLRELHRLDIKNRSATPVELEAQVIKQLRAAADEVDALIIADQVEEADHGVITATVRAELARLGAARPELVLMADSRRWIGHFEAVSLKPNATEARAAFGLVGDPVDLARQLAARQRRPVFITCGDEGAVAAEGGVVTVVPGVAVAGPLDIVGAGDSFCAGATAALAAGASAAEAAQVGCLVASITVQQIGTTGIATPNQVRARLAASPYKAPTWPRTREADTNCKIASASEP